MVLACRGRVVWTGMGKSGIICRKLAATMTSTGTPALFLHPAEAIHGDLGMVTRDDLVIAVSNSGETEELLRLVELAEAAGGAADRHHLEPATRTWPRAADVHLDLGVRREACPLNLTPTASTTASLALGDALAVAVAVRKGFQEQDFALLHPGGGLGKRFLKVRDLMHSGDAVPRVGLGTPMKDVIYEMSRKGLGVTTVRGRRRAPGGRDHRRRPPASDGARGGPAAPHGGGGDARRAVCSSTPTSSPPRPCACSSSAASPR